MMLGPRAFLIVHDVDVSTVSSEIQLVLVT